MVSDKTEDEEEGKRELRRATGGRRGPMRPTNHRLARLHATAGPAGAGTGRGRKGKVAGGTKYQPPNLI